MKVVLERIAKHARLHPERPALTDGPVSLGYAQLHAEIQCLASRLQARRVALLLPNGCAWAVSDLAAQSIGAACIPLPPFFTEAQLEHALRDAAPDLVLTDQPERLVPLLPESSAEPIEVAGQPLIALRMVGPRPAPELSGTAKITYTSGTTGQPKGVCLGADALDAVTIDLATAVDGGPGDRALALLPLATLLENIGGLYVPLYCGAQACLPDRAECGLRGSSGLDPRLLMASLHRFRPTTAILVPQLLKALVASAQSGVRVPTELRFLAVGGAPTSPALIEQARALGLPVFEGYGLSEACSVVSLNLPGRERVGSVGRPLRHARVRIAPSGEILVGGPLLQGYLGRPHPVAREWRTGDLGYLDEAGYLHITGRRQSAFATAYGRNVSPEWVEGELTAGLAVLQAAVFGAGRSFNVAVLVAHPRATREAVDKAVEQANRRLPDYAQVRRWILASEPFSTERALASASGAIDRTAVAAAYADRLEALYTQEDRHVSL